jgi:hypothetical protein
MPDTPTNAKQRRKSAAAAAPKGSGSKKNKSSNPRLGSLDGRREGSGVVEPLADGDSQRDEDTGAQSILQQYNKIRGG